MAYHVSVHVQNGDGSTRWIYRKPLGAEDTVFSFWHVAANDLGLPLVAQIYHEGLELRGDELDGLSSDLQRLEEHWIATGAGTGLQIPHLSIGADGRAAPVFVWFQDHLRERLALVREGIRVAKEAGGVMDIS